jgi:isoleucyl-tRNA synthetase
LRKAQDFEITDRIAIAISSNEKIDSAIEEFLDYIKVQVLADTLEITEETHSTEIDVNDEAITIDVKKI